ncbi:zinc-ribbon domain-containing protein [Niallia oryzisoli]|uniref:zinc-ribbon domain-containing protein n=1 Tax=Niallia oryzisoli TaxID=1737571 RepID=UPI00373544B5
MGNSIAECRPDLLKDWDYSKTIYNPYDVSLGSDKRIHWKCHVCGYEWEVEAKNRATTNTGCPLCMKRWNTSYNELTLSYYLKQVFISTINGFQLDIEEIKEVDIYIPDLNLVIEYDSLYHHEKREEIDTFKTKLLLKHRFMVIR